MKKSSSTSSMFAVHTNNIVQFCLDMNGATSAPHPNLLPTATLVLRPRTHGGEKGPRFASLTLREHATMLFPTSLSPLPAMCVEYKTGCAAGRGLG